MVSKLYTKFQQLSLSKSAILELLKPESKSSWQLSDSERNPEKHQENSFHRSIQSGIQSKAAQTTESLTLRIPKGDRADPQKIFSLITFDWHKLWKRNLA